MIYAISNNKGGVGKTTSTINLGAALVNKGKRVLLVDFDPQASLTQSLGILKFDYSIYEYLIGTGERPVETIEYKKNMWVIPAIHELGGAEFELISEPGREYILKDILDSVKQDFDHILIDCPPNLGLLTINALTAAQHVIIPMQAEYLSLKGVAKLIELVKKIQNRLNRELALGGLFLTQYDPRKVLNREVSKNVEDYFKEKFMISKISNNVTLAEAPSKGQDIFLYNSNSKGALDYQELCEEFIRKEIF